MAEEIERLDPVVYITAPGLVELVEKAIDRDSTPLVYNDSLPVFVENELHDPEDYEAFDDEYYEDEYYDDYDNE